MSLIYFIIFVLMILIEAFTVALVTIWFAIGALIALIASLYIEDSLILFAIFVVSSIISLVITKPLFKKHLKKSSLSDDGIVSKKVKVIGLDEETNTAKIKIGDVIWDAYSNKELNVDDMVIVKKIEGNKLIVEKENV